MIGIPALVAISMDTWTGFGAAAGAALASWAGVRTVQHVRKRNGNGNGNGHAEGSGSTLPGLQLVDRDWRQRVDREVFDRDGLRKVIHDRCDEINAAVLALATEVRSDVKDMRKDFADWRVEMAERGIHCSHCNDK